MKVFRTFLLGIGVVPAVLAADKATVRDLKPGDFLRVECRWRNVDKPPTALVCPQVVTRDMWGRITYQRSVSSLDRRGFPPDDPAVERWQVHYLVGGGAKPPADAEVFFTTLPSNTVFMAVDLLRRGDAATLADIEVSIQRQTLKSRGGIGKRPPL